MPTDSDSTSPNALGPLTFGVQFPGVVVLPVRTISFFKIRPRGTSADPAPMVKVSAATDEVSEMKVGDVLVVDSIEVHLTRLDDPETTPLPVGSSLVPAPSA